MKTKKNRWKIEKNREISAKNRRIPKKIEDFQKKSSGNREAKNANIVLPVRARMNL